MNNTQLVLAQENSFKNNNNVESLSTLGKFSKELPKRGEECEDLEEFEDDESECADINQI